MELLKQQVEALIFCSEQSISLDEIKDALLVSFEWEPTDDEVLAVIEEIKAKYKTEEFSFELLEISEGYQFLTKKQYHPVISALIQNKAKKKLSTAQMETLAIIAYRQPISKGEVEHIRGVTCDYAIQKLLEKELIGISGKSDGPGRPILYSTSHTFMDYFGIKSVKDLPQLKDLHVEQNEIGISSEFSDDASAMESTEPTVEPDTINPETTDDNGLTTEWNEEQPLILEAENEVVVVNERFDNGQVFPSSESALEANADIIDRKAIFLDSEEKSAQEREEELRKDEE